MLQPVNFSKNLKNFFFNYFSATISINIGQNILE